jgi:hypothetical protein
MPAICAITDCCELFIAHPLCGRLFSRERVSFSLRVSTTTDTKRLQRPLFFLSRSWTEILAYLRRHKSQGGTASAIHVGFGQHDVKLSLLPNLPVPEGAGTGSLCPRPTMRYTAYNLSESPRLTDTVPFLSLNRLLARTLFCSHHEQQLSNARLPSTHT